MMNSIANIVLHDERVCLIKEVCGNLLGNEAYVCGGSLRDLCIGQKEGHDLDVFINNRKVPFKNIVDELRQVGRIEYGQYGAPRLFINSDLKYIDIVPFTNFDGYGFLVTNVDYLLKNFDFTANAIGVNITTGEMYNPVNGIEDIEKKILRAVRTDFPEMPVSDKIPLSAVSVFWFRLLHYQVKLGFTFDDTTEQWIIENKYRIKDKKMFAKYFFEPQIDEQIKKKLG